MRFAAVILAGGQSRRMGTDKAGIVFGGKSLLEITAEKLDFFGERYISSNGGHAVEGWISIEDIYIGRGPAAGIFTALRKMDSDALFVTACDMPLLTRDSVIKLCSLYDGKSDAIVLRSAGNIDPLTAVYGKGTADKFEKAILEGELSVRSIIKNMKVHEVDAEKISSRKYEFINMNTPEELRIIREVYHENGII